MNLIEKIKDGITDFIGLIIIIATLTKLWYHEIEWIWDGLIGLGVGFILFVFPEKLLIESLKKVFNKYFGKEEEKVD